MGNGKGRSPNAICMIWQQLQLDSQVAPQPTSTYARRSIASGDVELPWCSCTVVCLSTVLQLLCSVDASTPERARQLAEPVYRIESMCISTVKVLLAQQLRNSLLRAGALRAAPSICTFKCVECASRVLVATTTAEPWRAAATGYTLCQRLHGTATRSAQASATVVAQEPGSDGLHNFASMAWACFVGQVAARRPVHRACCCSRRHNAAHVAAATVA